MGNDFNFDYGVSFTPERLDDAVYNYGTQSPANLNREGTSVFFKDEDGRVFHTYSAYSRGIDLLNTAYNYLDLVPKGRDEDGRGPRSNSRARTSSRAVPDRASGPGSRDRA